jgi:hypothetical protein
VLCVLQSLIARPRVPNLFPPYSLSLCALITVYQSLAEVDEDVSNKKSLGLSVGEIVGAKRECVLFIGTQFSNFYTSVDTPAESA